MDNAHWVERWRDGRIGFHKDVVNEHLEAFGPRIFGEEPIRVLVPMCGKSLDLLWLEQRGHHVIGLELAEQAVQEFFAEHERPHEVTQNGRHRVFESGSLTIIQGDLFDLPPALPQPVQGIYDRAAFHALKTPERRERYASILDELLDPGGSILLLTLDYDEEEMEGPPFSVPEAEIQSTFGQEAQVDRLFVQEVIHKEPKFRERGCTACKESVHFVKKSSANKKPSGL